MVSSFGISSLDWQRAACCLMTIDLPWFTKHGNVQDAMSEEGALLYYRDRLEVHLWQRFNDQDWQVMVALGYAVDALHWLYAQSNWILLHE